VGESWSAIDQYIFWVCQDISYQFSTIAEDFSVAYEIYWALNLKYSVDVAPCWMVIQKCIYKTKGSEADKQTGTPLAEVMGKLQETASGKRKRKPKELDDFVCA